MGVTLCLGVTRCPSIPTLQGLLWKRLRERKGRIVPKNESSAAVGTDGERHEGGGDSMGAAWRVFGDSCVCHRAPSRSGSHESLLPAPSAAELDLSGENVIVRPVHGSIVGEKFCFQVVVLGEGQGEQPIHTPYRGTQSTPGYPAESPRAPQKSWMCIQSMQGTL